MLVKFYQFGIFYDDVVHFYSHWEYFTAIWFIYSHFGILYNEKPGNPEWKSEFKKCVYFELKKDRLTLYTNYINGWPSTGMYLTQYIKTEKVSQNFEIAFK
jgi:hypothetical protein